MAAWRIKREKNNWEVIRNTMEIRDKGIELKKLILQ